VSYKEISAAFQLIYKPGFWMQSHGGKSGFKRKKSHHATVSPFSSSTRYFRHERLDWRPFIKSPVILRITAVALGKKKKIVNIFFFFDERRSL